MKKKMMEIALALMLAFSLCAPSFAVDDPGKETHYVTDTYGLLSFDEWSALEKRAANISEQYRCGIYIFTVDDYENYGYGDVYDVTVQIYHDSDNSFGIIRSPLGRRSAKRNLRAVYVYIRRGGRC